MILGNNLLRMATQNGAFTGLTFQPKRTLYIHLLDHLKKINPEKTKLNASFRNPKYITDEAPVQPLIQIKLKNRFQRIVDRKLFEDYKTKVLTGKIHQEQQKEIDELWGEDGAPIHYYHYFTLAQLMKVSHPQQKQVEHFIKELTSNKLIKLNKDILSKYNPKDVDSVISAVLSMSTKQIAEFTFALASQNDSQILSNRNIWFTIDKILQKKAFQLTTSELIKTKQAFLRVKQYYGSPNLNSILRDLIQQDMNNNKLTLTQLVAFFYTLRSQANGKTPLIQKIIENILAKVDHTTSLQDRLDILLIYCYGKKPMTSRPIHKKLENEDIGHSIRLFYNLNLHNLVVAEQLNENRISKLLYCLTKLRISRCRNVMDEVDKYCMQNQDKLSPEFVYTVLTNLNNVENMQGHYNEPIFKMLYEKMEINWNQYSTIQKIKMIHALWTVRMWDEKLENLYKETQMQPESSILHYFAQIQRHQSSGRQWQILHYLAQLDSIPLPYFQNISRFVNYIKSITNWNLKPIVDKLKNTQCHFDIYRDQKNHLFNKNFYPKLKKFLDFASPKGRKDKLIFPLNPGHCIDSIEFVMFAWPEYQISFDIVSDQQCLYGKQLLKKTYYSKMESLYSLGWRHFALHERNLNDYSLLQQIMISVSQATEYIEQQKERIQQQKQIRSHQITNMRNQNRWTFMTGEQVQNWTNDPESAARIEAEKEETQKKLQEILLKKTK